MNNSAYYQKIYFILKRAKDYYYNNIDTIRKNMRDKYKKKRKEKLKYIKKL